MTRAISIVVGVVILLVVGWFFGHRPVSELETQLERQEARFQTEKAELEARVRQAETRGYLWSAHAELLIAARDVEQRNFGTAANRVSRVHDLITRAGQEPSLALPLDELRGLVDGAKTRVDNLDPAAVEFLRRGADEMIRILEKMGQA